MQLPCIHYFRTWSQNGLKCHWLCPEIYLTVFCSQDFASNLCSVSFILFSYCKVSLIFQVAARCFKAARHMWHNVSSPYLCQVHSLALYLFQIRYAGAADSSVQFIFYQPIVHRWRETDFFPCSASCGGGNELPLYSRNSRLHTGSVRTSALIFGPLKWAKSENENSYI